MLKSQCISWRCNLSWIYLVLRQFQITRRFGFSMYITFAMHLDITLCLNIEKNNVSRKAKKSYDLEWRECIICALWIQNGKIMPTGSLIARALSQDTVALFVRSTMPWGSATSETTNLTRQSSSFRRRWSSSQAMWQLGTTWVTHMSRRRTWNWPSRPLRRSYSLIPTTRLQGHAWMTSGRV